jgi:HK97 family phage prohead protease
MNDTIAAAGWDLTDFQANPVALWAHDSCAPPIGGARNVAVEGDHLLGDIEFAPPETYAFADTIYRLVLGKFLRAVSVGFLPTRYAFVENDPECGFGIDFLEQSLLEISICPVPANPNALQEARRQGIDMRPLVEWAERTLDCDGKASLPRAELERLRRAAKEPAMTARTPPRSARSGRPARRTGNASEDDPTVCTCGRSADDECGLADPSECAVHGGDAAPPEADEKLLATLRRLLGRRKDGDAPDNDDLPVAHEDAIRLAHKSMRTAKAYTAEGMTHHAKALSLPDGVVDALDADPITGPPADPDPDANTEKAALHQPGGAIERYKRRGETDAFEHHVAADGDRPRIARPQAVSLSAKQISTNFRCMQHEDFLHARYRHIGPYVRPDIGLVRRRENFHQHERRHQQPIIVSPRGAGDPQIGHPDVVIGAHPRPYSGLYDRTPLRADRREVVADQPSGLALNRTMDGGGRGHRARRAVHQLPAIAATLRVPVEELHHSHCRWKFARCAHAVLVARAVEVTVVMPVR